VAGWIILSVLAAFGVLCVIWALFGFLLPGQRGAVLVCLCRPGNKEEVIIRHYGWLRDLGLSKAPLLLVDGGLTEEERARLLQCRQGVEICSPEELIFRLEQERNRLDGTGT
jgi:hypothetical protein